MYCTQCGHKLQDGSNFCTNCGKRAPSPAPPKYEHIEFKVNGVTFKNDDGSNRQTILRKLKYRDPPFDGKIETQMRGYDFEGETAVAILVNNKQIGNMPKELVATVLEHRDDNIGISAIDVVGGGKTEDGEPLSYGAKAVLRYEIKSAAISN